MLRIPECRQLDATRISSHLLGGAANIWLLGRPQPGVTNNPGGPESDPYARRKILDLMPASGNTCAVYPQEKHNSNVCYIQYDESGNHLHWQVDDGESHLINSQRIITPDADALIFDPAHRHPDSPVPILWLRTADCSGVLFWDTHSGRLALCHFSVCTMFDYLTSMQTEPLTHPPLLLRLLEQPWQLNPATCRVWVGPTIGANYEFSAEDVERPKTGLFDLIRAQGIDPDEIDLSTQGRDGKYRINFANLVIKALENIGIPKGAIDRSHQIDTYGNSSQYYSSRYLGHLLAHARGNPDREAQRLGAQAKALRRFKVGNITVVEPALLAAS